jgi:hypothetical protein
MSTQTASSGSGADAGPTARVQINRVLAALSLLAIVLGVALGQHVITWLNATLL